MTKTLFLSCSLLLLTAPLRAQATHNFEEIAPGVYFATEAGPLYLMSNALAIVNDDHVVVVDSHVTPAAGRALIAAIGELTDKPIRYLINSHYHFDHAHGNQSFSDDVVVIGHDYTYEKLSGKPLEERTFLSFNGRFDDRLAALEECLEAAASEERAAIEEQVRVLSSHIRDTKEIVPRPPDVTLDGRLTLQLGGREIQLHFFGRGHTGGDVVVFLPDEKLVFTGDLLLPGPSYMGDGYVGEWPDTLERLKSLGFELVAPGHGQPFRDRERIDNLQSYYRDLYARVVKLHGEGVSFAEAAVRVDMTDHSGALPIRAPGIDVRAVERIYSLLEKPE